MKFLIGGATIDLTQTVRIDPASGGVVPCSSSDEGCIGVVLSPESAEALGMGDKWIDCAILQFLDASRSTVSVLIAIDFTRKRVRSIGWEEFA